MAKVLIVGGGIAGLSAESYLQMNGYQTEIFEQHRAGGLCTSWKRKGYTIDGCIHWWIGVNPKDPVYPILDGLLDMEKLPKVIYEAFLSVETEGKVLRFMGNLDRFEAELKAIAPEDGKSIDELISMARKMASFSLPGEKAVEVMNLWEKLQMMRRIFSVRRIFNTCNPSVDEYFEKFQSPLVKKFFSLLSWFWGSVLGIIMNMAWFHNKNAGYPIGGAEELTKRLVQRYQSLGGKLHEYSKVKKIIVEEGIAKALELENKKKYRADYIISAADGYNTMVHMLGESYADEEKKKLYFSEKYIPKKSCLYISLGVAREFKDSFKPYVYIFFKKPLKICENTEVTNIGITIHNFDPTSAPQGKTLLTMMIPVYDNTEYWVKMRNENRAEYEKRKKEIAEHLIEELEAHFGDIKNKVEMIDVATPATYIRYTNNWNGSFGWDDFYLFYLQTKKRNQGIKKFLYVWPMGGRWRYIGSYAVRKRCCPNSL